MHFNKFVLILYQLNMHVGNLLTILTNVDLNSIICKTFIKTQADDSAKIERGVAIEKNTR